MFELYATPLSANARKALAVVAHLDLAPTIHEVNVYAGEGRAPDYLAVHPLGKVPALVDGPLRLWESNAILVYVAEAYGDGRLWSRDPAARADIARWLFWEASAWQPALTPVLRPAVGHALRPDVVPAPADAPDWDDPALAPLLRLLGDHLADRAWLVGETPTLADLSVAGMATYLRYARFPFERHPAFAAWYARVEALPAWRRTAVAPWSGA